MKIQTLHDIPELKGKKVLLRVDFNVPMEDGKIQDDARIAESIPTIKFLQQAGAKIIIMSHLGRPDGQVKEELRLTPIAKHLETLLGSQIKKLDTVLGPEVQNSIDHMQDGEIIMLENIRFHIEEEKCDPQFTEELSKLGNLFVNDAFGTAHRKHASTAGLADFLPAYAGLLMEKEIKHLSPLLTDEPKRPLTMIFGGAKIDTKIGIIKNFINKADNFLIGGALANTFLAAAGYNIGASLYEEDKLDLAREIMMECEKNQKRFIIPHDVVVATEISPNSEALDLLCQDVMGDMKILDIGRLSAAKYAEIVKKSGTVIWNGPLGYCELDAFQNGSKVVALALTEHDCTSIVGGGDTADSIKRLGVDKDKFTHISTGGGACIEFLSGDKLPGIEILKA